MRLIATLFFLAAVVSALGQGITNVYSLTAHYQTEIHSGKKTLRDEWRFVRATNQVNHEREERTSRWTKLSEREVALEQIFPREKIVLEFTHGDIKARGEDFQWPSLYHVVDTNLLSQLAPKGTKKILGRRGTLYKGRINDVDWELLWLEDVKLAGRIVRRDKNGRMKTELKMLSATAEAQEQNLAGFRRVDYADLGDLESDLSIQQLLKHSQGDHPGHRH